MVMSRLETTHPPANMAAQHRYARPLGRPLQGQFHRFPLVIAAIAVASLFMPWGQAQAAAIEPPARGDSIAIQSGLQPAAQQRQGRSGGGGRDFRGGGGTRQFRGSVRNESRQQFRQDRQANRQDFRQDFRQGGVNRQQFRDQRRDNRQDFRQDRRADNRNVFNDQRNFNNRRDFDNRRGFDNRRFDNRRFDNRRWDRGWRNDRRYDWVGFRNQNRNFFRGGPYFSPVRGWGYRRLGIGFTLGAPFFASNFWINDPFAFRLPPAFGQLRWVRYFGDVLLVDIYTGQVVDVIPDFFW